MFPGILDQSKFLDSGGQETVVLQLLGNNYQDTSSYNHTVNIVGSVPINNGGFNITHVGDNYLEIPDHPAFSLGTDDFYIQYDFKSLSSNIDSAHFFSQYNPGDIAYAVRSTSSSTSVTYSINGSGGSGVSASYPDTNYFTDFQTVKILKTDHPNFNSDAFLFYYNDVLIGTSNVIYGANTAIYDSGAPIRIGKHIIGLKYGSVNFVIKNIKLVKII